MRRLIPQPHGGALLDNLGRQTARARVIPPSTADIAWAAGIYEGEGCAKDERVQVVQKRPWILLKLRARFGGRIVAYNARQGGHGRRGAIYWLWVIHGGRARGFLLTIYQFLSPYRREQARRLLAYTRPHRSAP
jgi:hypothetical protein